MSPAAQTPATPLKQKSVPTPLVRQLTSPFLGACPSNKGPGVLAPNPKSTSPAAAARVNGSLGQQVLPFLAPKSSAASLAPQPGSLISHSGLHTAQRLMAPNVAQAPLAGQQSLTKQASWHQAFLQQAPISKAHAAVKQQAGLGGRRPSQHAHDQGMAGSSAAHAPNCQQRAAGSQQGRSLLLPKTCKMSSSSKAEGSSPSSAALPPAAHALTKGRVGAPDMASKRMLQGSTMTQQTTPMSQQSPRPPTDWSRSITAQTTCLQPAAQQVFLSAQASHSHSDTSLSAQHGGMLPPAALRASLSPPGAHSRQAAPGGQQGPLLVQAQVPGSNYCWPAQLLPVSAQNSGFQTTASMGVSAQTDSAVLPPIAAAGPSAPPSAPLLAPPSAAPSAAPSAYLRLAGQAACGLTTVTAQHWRDLTLQVKPMPSCQPTAQASSSQLCPLTCIHSPRLHNQTPSQQPASGTACGLLPSAAVPHSVAQCLVGDPGPRAAPSWVTAAQTLPVQASAAQRSAAATSASRAAAKMVSTNIVSHAQASATHASAGQGSAAQGSAIQAPASQGSAANSAATQTMLLQAPIVNSPDTQTSATLTPPLQTLAAQTPVSLGVQAQSLATLGSIHRVHASPGAPQTASSAPLGSHHQQGQSAKSDAAQPTLQTLAPQLLALFGQPPACSPVPACSKLAENRPTGAQLDAQLPTCHAPRQAKGLQSCAKPTDRHPAERQLPLPMAPMTECQKRQGMVQALSMAQEQLGKRPCRQETGWPLSPSYSPSFCASDSQPLLGPKKHLDTADGTSAGGSTDSVTNSRLLSGLY